MFKHRTKDGRVLKISDMSDDHLINTVLLWQSMAHKGITIYDGGGIDSDDIWFDVDFVMGEAALDCMNYHRYTDELKRRGIPIPSVEVIEAETEGMKKWLKTYQGVKT